MTGPLLNVEGLRIAFPTRQGPAAVVTDLSFTVNAGEVLGIVGESGCGKSMTALSLLRLVPPPGRIVAGRIIFDSEDLLAASDERMLEVRGDRISMIFQEPMTALNPVFTVGNQITEAIRRHRDCSRTEARRQAIDILDSMRVPAAARRMREYPHQLSGGLRQRVMIGMALACSPKMIVADEPTTALDVTVQAEIFELLRDVQRERGTAIVLITHDFGVVGEMTDRVVVMYAGHKVEEGPTPAVVNSPRHPYTSGLLSCVTEVSAEAGPVRRMLAEISGTVPELNQLRDSGCQFRGRCQLAGQDCVVLPPLTEVGSTHTAACWRLALP